MSNKRCWTDNNELNKQAWIMAEKRILYLEKENKMLQELCANHAYWVEKALRLEKRTQARKHGEITPYQPSRR